MRLGGPGLCVFLLAVVACDGGSGDAVELRPKPHALVDNLIVAESRRGSTGLLGLTGGRILLDGRCLILEKEGVRATPVFASRATVLPHGLRLAGQELEWGDSITFRASGMPMPIKALEGTGCPASGISVRGVQ